MTLAVYGLSHERNGRRLFDQLTFRVYPGEALHVHGPNGVGKTSLLQILAGLVLPLSGHILWNTIPIHNSPCFKSDLLYVSHKLGMKNILTPFENLYLFLVRRGLELTKAYSLNQIRQKAKEKINDVLAKLELEFYINHLTHSLSAGQRRRLALAKLLLAKADCWILDEPFTALDKKGISLVTDLIKEQLLRGGIVIFTSHQPLALSGVLMKNIFLSGDSV
jgi:heme exporter protein A